MESRKQLDRWGRGRESKNNSTVFLYSPEYEDVIYVEKLWTFINFCFDNKFIIPASWETNDLSFFSVTSQKLPRTL